MALFSFRILTIHSVLVVVVVGGAGHQHFMYSKTYVIFRELGEIQHAQC